MYKSASSNQQRHSRTGSYSLTVKASGKYDHLPLNLGREEEVYQSLKQQWESSRDALEQIKAEKALLRKRLSGEFDEQRRALIKQTINELREKEAALTASQGHLRKLAREGGEMVYATLFMYVAKQVLGEALITQIDVETRTILGRSAHEKPRPANLSDEARKALQMLHNGRVTK